MADINKIAEAIVALVNALPGKSADRVTSVSLHGCDSARFRAVLDAGATLNTYQSDDGSREWDSATLYVGNLAIHAFSDHRPIVRVEVDPHAVEAALAQAQEALS